MTGAYQTMACSIKTRHITLSSVYCSEWLVYYVHQVESVSNMMAFSKYTSLKDYWNPFKIFPEIA